MRMQVNFTVLPSLIGYNHRMLKTWASQAVTSEMLNKVPNHCSSSRSTRCIRKRSWTGWRSLKTPTVDQRELQPWSIGGSKLAPLCRALSVVPTCRT